MILDGKVLAAGFFPVWFCGVSGSQLLFPRICRGASAAAQVHGGGIRYLVHADLVHQHLSMRQALENTRVSVFISIDSNHSSVNPKHFSCNVEILQFFVPGLHDRFEGGG